MLPAKNSRPHSLGERHSLLHQRTRERKPKLAVVAHICNPSTFRTSLADLASLGYKIITVFKIKGGCIRGPLLGKGTEGALRIPQPEGGGGGEIGYYSNFPTG